MFQEDCFCIFNTDIEQVTTKTAIHRFLTISNNKCQAGYWFFYCNIIFSKEYFSTKISIVKKFWIIFSQKKEMSIIIIFCFELLMQIAAWRKMISLKYEQFFQGGIVQYSIYNVFLKVWQLLMHSPVLVTCFINPLILYSKLKIIKKDIRKGHKLAKINNETSAGRTFGIKTKKLWKNK